jgi:hypothetical protein
MPKILGDPHNCGRHVRLMDDGKIDKPRGIGWEWLFLSANPFREFLERQVFSDDSPSPFLLFPVLSFSPNSPRFESGVVTQFRWSNETPPLTEAILSLSKKDVVRMKAIVLEAVQKSEKVLQETGDEVVYSFCLDWFQL